MSSSVQPQHQIEQRPVANRWTGRFGRKPVAIVEHSMHGTIDETFPIFNRESSPVYDLSANYAIGRDGHIVAFVPEEDTAWANGVVQDPDSSIGWLREAVEKNENLNTLTISIEYEGFSGETLTEEQYLAALWLHQQICQRWGITLDADHIIGHNRIDSRERTDSPGDAFPWHRLLYDLSLSALGHATPAPTPAVTQQTMAATEPAVAPEPAWSPESPVAEAEPELEPTYFNFNQFDEQPDAQPAEFNYKAPSEADTQPYTFGNTHSDTAPAAFTDEDFPAFSFDETSAAQEEEPSYINQAAPTPTFAQPAQQQSPDPSSSFGSAFDDMPAFDFGATHEDTPQVAGDIPTGKGTLYTPDDFDELPDFLRETEAELDSQPAHSIPQAAETKNDDIPAFAFTHETQPAQQSNNALFDDGNFDELPDFLKIDASDLEDTKTGGSQNQATTPFATFDAPAFGQNAATHTFPSGNTAQPSQSSSYGSFGEFDLPDFETMNDDASAQQPAKQPDIVEEMNQPRTGAGALPLEAIKTMPIPAQTEGDVGGVTAVGPEPKAATTSAAPNPADFAGVPNIAHRDFGPVRVQVELANIRDKPSYDPASIIRVAKYGDQFSCDATGEGPELFGRTTWYHVRASDGGGWVHSALVDYV